MENEHCSKRLLALLKSFGFKTSTKTRRCFIIPVSELEKFKVKVDKKYSRYLELMNGKVMKCLNELTHGEIEQLKAQRGVQYPELFYPFLTDDIDLDLSRIIYINDDPAAWIIFKLLSTSVVYVDRLHIKKLYKFRGLCFPLFYNTYINLSEEIKKIVLYIRGNNSKMLGLFKLFNDCEKAEDTAVELIKDLTVD